MRITLVMLLIAVFGVVGCGANRAAGNSVSAEEGYNLWRSGDAVLLDVRTAEEYAAGHVPGVQLIPLQELERRLDEVPRDKPVLVICRSGNRSAQAVKLLRDKGFANVRNFSGGMNVWPGPVETK